MAIQRIIEIFMSLPQIPLWIALAAALPRDWSVIKTYFAITVILSLVGWTTIVTVLAFNFLGDGLRDAADPYR